MLSAENSGKPFDGRGFARTPLGEFTALPDLLAGGKGVAAVVKVRGAQLPAQI